MDNGEKKRVLKPDLIIGEGVEQVPSKQSPEAQQFLSQLEKAKSPNQKAEIISQIIASSDTTMIMNAISRAEGYPNGVRQLVEAVIRNQQSEQKVGALIWLVENSVQVQRAPKLKYLVVKAIIDSRNHKAIDKIGTLSTVQEVPLLIKAIKSGDTSGIKAALDRFESSSSQ